jgi:hypothetical protein
VNRPALIFEQSSDFKEPSHRLDDIALERDDESPALAQDA